MFSIHLSAIQKFEDVQWLFALQALIGTMIKKGLF